MPELRGGFFVFEEIATSTTSPQQPLEFWSQVTRSLGGLCALLFGKFFDCPKQMAFRFSRERRR